MSYLSEEKRQAVFKERLVHLWNEGYLSDDEYGRVLEAHHSDINEQQSLQEQKEAMKVDRAEPVEEAKPEPAKPEKVKKVKSAEEIRERNITWSLILGVSLLLITGLIVATSQWNQMGAGMKVFSLAFVSLFFFGLSYVTGRFLKITQTAFAFLTLGSLLIPIAIVAIGYFELLGSYLSLFGEGRYLLGFLGAFLPLSLYVRIAFVHQSRLYVWISLLFLSLSVGFALGALPLATDVFYLLLMVFNAGLLVFHVRFKDSEKWQLFMKEFPLYAQMNLVLSTLLLLFFFESEVFYSFNLLLTAGIYMAMVFVYKTKEYQFVFSVMVVYAIYQLVEHSPLQSLDLTVYALVGLIYLGFAYAFRNHKFVEKVFRYTSGVVSFFAFVYISYESILLRGEEGSWVLLTAYVIITANYLLLANLTGYVVFLYMTPVFFFITFWQLWELTETGPLFFFLFAGASLVLVYVGLWTENTWLKVIQESTFHLCLMVMAGAVVYALYEMVYGYSALMLLLVSIQCYLVKKKHSSHDIKITAVWGQPINLLLAGAIIYEPMSDRFPGYEESLSMPFHYAVIGVLLLIVHLGWKRVSEKELSTATFYVSQVSYSLGMVLLLNNTQVEGDVVRPLILLVGIAMLYSLVQFAKQTFLWLLVSLVTLAFYASLMDTLELNSFSAHFIYMVFAPVLLVGLGELGEKKWPGIRPYFYWLGHGLLPLLIAVYYLDQLGIGNVQPWVLVIPLALYIFSSLNTKHEWVTRLMLYAGMTTFFVMILTSKDFYGWGVSIPSEYVYILTSLCFAVLWGAVPLEWSRRIEWYLIPFSMIGLMVIINQPGRWFSLDWLVVLGYAVLILFFLHRRGWTLARFIPLILTIGLWEKVSMDWERLTFLTIMVICIGVLVTAGRYFHKYLISPKYEVDAYSWTALVYIAYTNLTTMMDENVWIRITPLLLLSLWLFINAAKWSLPILRKVFITAGAGGLYASYILVLVDHRHMIPDLIEAELLVLPVLLVLFFLKKRTWKEYAPIMNHVQFAVLLLIAAYLVIDAIRSHTIWDAWIIGGLSLLSMIAGMQWRIKSYFFVGMGVLIFNVLYQTKPYWGNMPWWVYLLLAGIILIGIASYNEWQKQQTNASNPIERKLKGLWAALKKWN
ncbi:hypothetical protein [Halobacillus litoralis]|uniref:hypothetical protein n=1 Tax=Halobacillus litoralis TaxID=45668 RepID=UPI0024920C3D|nr:hypothetical protein [Halobacillus litoralis]